MSETIFYKKEGRKYVEVGYYDSEVMDSIPEGSHLIVKRKGVDMRRYNVEPAIAPMVAAGLYAKDYMTMAIMRASELRIPKEQTPLTPEQSEAWTNLAKSFGKEMYTLEWPSYAEVAEAGVKALEDEAEKLLAHPSVRSAYEHFLLTAKLAYEAKDE